MIPRANLGRIEFMVDIKDGQVVNGTPRLVFRDTMLKGSITEVLASLNDGRYTWTFDLDTSKAAIGYKMAGKPIHAYPDCAFLGSIDIYLDGKKLEEPFQADEETGEVLCCYRDVQGKYVEEVDAEIGALIWEGLQVINLKGKVEIKVTPIAGYTEEYMREEIHNSGSPAVLTQADRLDKLPASLERFHETVKKANSLGSHGAWFEPESTKK